MRILFTGGGTAGHINPAIAMADFIKEKEPQTEILFVGTKEGMEKNLVPKSGYDIEFIKVHGFKRSLSLKNIKNLFEIAESIRKTKKIIKRFKPDVAVGTGGYVTGPVIMAAAQMKIPTLVHESNAFPGVTIRLLSGRVNVVALAMEDAKKYISGAKRIEITGNPLRPELFKTNKKAAREKLELDERPVILVFGGSLGAAYFNEQVINWIGSMEDKDKYQIVMSAGKNNQYENVKNMLNKQGINLEMQKNIRVLEYIYDMASALNACDLIIGRSGSSVCEMTALGKPSILVPSPNVAGNHQEFNARFIENNGAAKVILESELSGETLKCAVEEILGSNANYSKMSENATKIGIKDATDRLYGIIKEITGKA